MQMVIAAQAMAVPKSGSRMINPRKTRVGITAGSNVVRRSFIDLVRLSRKYARNRISAGLANSDGWRENPPQ